MEETLRQTRETGHGRSEGQDGDSVKLGHQDRLYSKVRSEQRLEGDEALSQAERWGRTPQTEGTSGERFSGGHPPGVGKNPPGGQGSGREREECSTPRYREQGRGGQVRTQKPYTDLSIRQPGPGKGGGPHLGQGEH